MNSLQTMKSRYIELSNKIARANEIVTLCYIEQEITQFKYDIEGLPLWDWQKECNNYYTSLISASDRQTKLINIEKIKTA